MITAIVIGVAFITLLVGYVVGAVRHTDPLPDCCLKCLHGHRPEHMIFSPVCCDHFGIQSLEKQLAGLRADNQILRDMTNNLRSMNHAKIYYAQTPAQQELVDLVVKAAAPFDELRDKLGIK